MKKFVSLLLSLSILFLVSSSSVFASDIKIPPKSFGSPVRENKYYDEELQAFVTQKIYFVSDCDLDVKESRLYPSGKSGRGWYRNENIFDWTSGKRTTTYAQGYFKWGNGDISVSNSSGGYDYFPAGMTITKDEVSSGTGKRFGFFGNYAYVKYKFAFTNFFGKNEDVSVSIKVDSNGSVF